MSRPTACWGQALVDRHFEATITPDQERKLRTHIEACPQCQTRYERRMLLAALDPQAPDARTRLGVGLGLLPRRGPSRGAWAAAAGVCAAAAVVLVVLMPGVTGQDGGPAPAHPGGRVELPVRRGRASRGATVSVSVFRAWPGGESRDIDSPIAADAALVFSYRNEARRARLLLFGVGDDGRVYWYHPQWQDPARDPVAAPVQGGGGNFVLTTAVKHRIAGQHLTLHALFVDEPHSVREVERRLLEEPGEVAELFPEAHHWTRTLLVER